MAHFIQLSHQVFSNMRDDRKTADCFQEQNPSNPSALHTCVETVSDMHGLDIQVCIQQTILLYSIIYIDMHAVLYEKT